MRALAISQRSSAGTSQAFFAGNAQRRAQTCRCTWRSAAPTCDCWGIIENPGKPAQNGTVERSHREDQEKLYDQVAFTSEEDLRYHVRLWNMYYNDLEHCGLNGKTPNEFLANYQLINPPNMVA